MKFATATVTFASGLFLLAIAWTTVNASNGEAISASESTRSSWREHGWQVYEAVALETHDDLGNLEDTDIDTWLFSPDDNAAALDETFSAVVIDPSVFESSHGTLLQEYL